MAEVQDSRSSLEDTSHPPSPRCHMTLVPHPTQDKLILFGGELCQDNRVTTYNDLFMFDINSRVWQKLDITPSPSSRSSHQVSTVSHNGGEMWLHGGEVTVKKSVSHLRDLWLLNLAEMKWRNIRSSGGPSARSGHRMIVFNNHLLIFGGFFDDNKNYRYFNDINLFSLNHHRWSIGQVSGTGPCPRSASQIAVLPSHRGIVVYGGYSRTKVNDDIDQGHIYNDMFILTYLGEDAYAWSEIKQSGEQPSPRVAMTWVQTTSTRAVCFGGVFDENESEDDLEGRFYNDLYMVDLETGVWTSDIIGTKKLTLDRKRPRGSSAQNGGSNETSEGLAKRLKISDSQQGTTDIIQSATSSYLKKDSKEFDDVEQNEVLTDCGDDVCIDAYAPSPRMHTCLAVKNAVLYLFGGSIEKADRLITLGDFYSLDLRRMKSWSTIISQCHTSVLEDKPPAVADEIDDEEKDNSGDDDEDSEDSIENSEVKVTFADAQLPSSDEREDDYYERTSDYWRSKARQCSDIDNLHLSSRNILKLSRDLAIQFYQSKLPSKS